MHNPIHALETMSDPRTIKALACFGKGEPVKPWEYESRPLGAEDVEIKISHCGICGSDLHTIDSGWKPTLYPCIVGHEIVGEVTQAGPDVKELKIGDRVGVGAQVWACLNKDPSHPCRDCAKGADAYCHGIVGTYNSKYQDGSKTYGGYAEYVRVLSNYAFKIPDSIPSDAAAPFLCAGTTVFTPFKEVGLKPGDRVGIVGIGGLGHLAIQFAKAMGADAVVAFSRSGNKEEEVRALGADEFVNYSDPVQAKAAEGSVDILLITADADGMPYPTFISFLGSRGTCIMVGLPNDEVKFKPAQIVMKGAKFLGSHIGSIQDVKDMLALSAEKNIRPVIQKLPMSRANEGIQMLRDGKVRYRVVLENETTF